MAITASWRDFPEEKRATRQRFATHYYKTTYVFQGALFVMLGLILAAILPTVLMFGIEIVLGALLIIAGLFQLVLSMQVHMHWWSLFSGMISIVMGLFLLWQPVSALPFVMTLALYVMVEGLFELMVAFHLRAARNWEWVLFSCAISPMLAAIVWASYPESLRLVLGWIISLNLLLYGLTLMMRIETFSARTGNRL